MFAYFRRNAATWKVNVCPLLIILHTFCVHYSVFVKMGGKKRARKAKAKVCCKSRAVLLVGGISLTESASHFWLVLLHSLH